MIVTDSDTAKLVHKPPSDSPPPPPPTAPPAFDIAEALPLPVAGGEEPPPEFTPYDAEFFFIDSDNIVSHDPHLNTDGEALYRFLLSQSSTPPTYRIHCHGSHTETRSRWVTHEHHGKYESRHESYSETITDFDFYIDVSQSLLGTDTAGPLMWSVSDSEPSYRGSMVRQVLIPDGLAKRKREGTAEEISAHKRWSSERASRGMPPWMTGVPSFQWTEGTPDIPNGAPRSSILRSSRTLREWADDYCASDKLLKEFVFEKVLYGWNVASLSSAIQSAIAASPYSGHIKVTISTRASKIIVRPDNQLSRLLTKRWLRIILWILLIYPFVWLFKRFHPRGGGRWEVCGGAYALKRWVPVDADDDMGGNETRRDEKQPYVPEASSSAASPSEPLPPPAFHTLQLSPSPLVDLSNANYTPLPFAPALRTSLSDPTNSMFADLSPPIASSSSNPYRPNPHQSHPYPSNPPYPIASFSGQPQQANAPRIINTPSGMRKLVGTREGEWFRAWYPIIVRAVTNRYQSSIPLTGPEGLTSGSVIGAGLDGW